VRKVVAVQNSKLTAQNAYLAEMPKLAANG
jgi:hypothetical protein